MSRGYLKIKSIKYKSNFDIKDSFINSRQVFIKTTTKSL